MLKNTTRGNSKRKPESAAISADQRLRALSEVIGPMAEALGANSEIILHDYRRPDHSVVAVAGSVTARKVGGAMSEIGLSMLSEGNTAGDRLNYLVTTRNGRIIKSSTIVLRDDAGDVFGALCINTDITELRQAAVALAGMVGEQVRPEPTTFSDDIRIVIDTVLAEQLDGRGPGVLSRDHRIAIFEALDRRGVFGIKRGLSQVAERLGISRATGYLYLQEIRERGAESGPIDDGAKRSARAGKRP
ncbi:MAG TPA: PAS domain-containing protein [Caballeronia sp.]|jgi:predicted transcriptional regulator YheO|nr:PAS domain-containing protein [Caballeronia sp.]